MIILCGHEPTKRQHWNWIHMHPQTTMMISQIRVLQQLAWLEGSVEAREEKVHTCVNQYKAGHWIDSTRLASDHFCEITERGSVQYSRRTPYSSNNTQLPNGSMQALTSSYSAISSVLSSMRVGGRRSAIMICVGE
jgi:hypothetical protein